jgi:hypothetical protein
VRKGEIPELPESVKENAVLDMAFSTTLMVDIWLVLLLVSTSRCEFEIDCRYYNFPNLGHQKMCQCAKLLSMVQYRTIILWQHTTTCTHIVKIVNYVEMHTIDHYKFFPCCLPSGMPMLGQGVEGTRLRYCTVPSS